MRFHIFAFGLWLVLSGLSQADPSADKEKSEPKLTCETIRQPSERKGACLVVFHGDGAGPIHRSGPEHFKLTRVSDGKVISLLIEYDIQTLDERDRSRREGTPRNPQMVTRALKSEPVFNELFKRVRFFLDNAPVDEKDPMEEASCLDLYGRAKLEPLVRYRLTWACWPVGAVKARELSVEFELRDMPR